MLEIIIIIIDLEPTATKTATSLDIYMNSGKRPIVTIIFYF